MAKAKKKEEELKPIFRKPYGPGQGMHDFFFKATEGPILCEACGTKHPKDERQGYGFITIFGRQLVERCCGKFVDELYEQFGDSFARAFLDGFADNPGDDKFALLRRILPEVIKTANRKIAELELNATLAAAAKSKD